MASSENTLHRIAAVTAITLLSAACTGDATVDSDTAPPIASREIRPGLTASYARARAARIADVGYRLHVDLDREAEHYTGRNTIGFDWLGAGRNEIVIDFAHDFTDNGVGLYRYDDPDDGNPYLYTDFEPYDANTAFPLFDQPDLKARFTLSVSAPDGWQVISTHRETGIEQIPGGRRIWQFRRRR